MKDNILKVIDIFLDEVDWENATEDYSKEFKELKEIQDSITDGDITEEQAQRLYEVTYFIIGEGYDVGEMIEDEFEDYTLNDFMNNLEEIANPEQETQEEREIDKIKAEINAVDELAEEFINDENLKAVQKYIYDKMMESYDSITDSEEKSDLFQRAIKVKTYPLKKLTKFINDEGYDKDDLCIEVLNKQIKELESSLINEQDVKLEVTKENKDIVIEKLKNNLNAQLSKTIVVENSLGEEKIKELLEKLESDLDVEELNKIVDEVSYDNSFVLDIYNEELNKIETEINKLESESNDSNNKNEKPIEDYNKKLAEKRKQESEIQTEIDKIKEELNKMQSSTIDTDKEKELQDKLAEYENKLNLVKGNIDFYEKVIELLPANKSSKEIESLKEHKEKLEKKINSLNSVSSVSNDEIKQKIKDKETLRDRFIKNKENKAIVVAYDNIKKNVIDELKDDEEFEESSIEEKFATIYQKITEHEDYEKIKNYYDENDKDKLTTELVNDIFKELDKKKVEVKNDKKAWYKSLAFWGGAALGGVLGFTVQPGNIGAIVAVGRIGYSIAKKAIKSYAEEHEDEDTMGMRVINRARDFKEGFKEKHPGIANKVKKINDFLKKPSTQLFLNGMAIGYTVGHIGRNVTNMFNNTTADGTNVVNNDTRVERPNGPTPSDSDTTRARMAEYVKNQMNNNDVSTSASKISKGQIWNVAGMNDGYGYDSSTMDKLLHLNQKLSESVKVMKTRTIDGVKMVLVNDTATNEPLGWFKAEDILEKATYLKK